MKIVFFGTPDFAVPTLSSLLSHPEFEVVGVVTQPDKRRGRGNQLMPSPVKDVALNHSLPVWQPRRIKKDAETLAKLREAEADVFVVVAYGQILSQEILDIPSLACVNVHGSILPKYRGAAPIQRCLFDGEKTTGITTMLMDAGMDTGAMLLKAFAGISLLDNADSLADRLAEIGADLLVETLVKLRDDQIEAVVQDDAEATYAPMIKSADCVLDWSKSAIDLHNQVRGFFPDCTTTFRGNSLKVIATVPVGPEYWLQLPPDLRVLEREWPVLDQLSGENGAVVKVVKGLGAIVQTGDGLLLLREVQLAGKKVQSGVDFANGTRLAVGEIFGS
ncbi:methionyl-tRNA formyltransferase [Oscillatoria nigro-viridis PCC 7112]|uniref:Methionyl-tRNA formyltransferase n=1 Tax=Phormidium nigroviride PCC 7112 TaxID=179408 RepID=K9VM97_9CYAN|nr:methionyl-tRNA formyltransferase [Oscillatoria nigro-viridis]AFZ08659.1 methionyl-tRNA formyltransferase [Oscillatoria nigro-viridis PCC 7112]